QAFSRSHRVEVQPPTDVSTPLLQPPCRHACSPLLQIHPTSLSMSELVCQKLDNDATDMLIDKWLERPHRPIHTMNGSSASESASTMLTSVLVGSRSSSGTKARLSPRTYSPAPSTLDVSFLSIAHGSRTMLPELMLLRGMHDRGCDDVYVIVTDLKRQEMDQVTESTFNMCADTQLLARRLPNPGCTDNCCELIRFPKLGLESASVLCTKKKVRYQYGRRARPKEMCNWIDCHICFTDDPVREGNSETGSSEGSEGSVDDSQAPKFAGFVCSRCKLVKYCSAEHQRQDWDEHRRSSRIDPCLTFDHHVDAYLTAKLAQQIDEELMSSAGAFSLDQLMELAGLACAQTLATVYSTEKYPRVLVCCGPGNQGGDGLVAARHLGMFGYKPTIWMPKLPAQPAGSKEIYRRLKFQCDNCNIQTLAPSADSSSLRDVLARSDVILDAIFGFSFQRPSRPRSTPPSRCSRVRPAHRFCGYPVRVGRRAGNAQGVGLEPDVLVSLTAPKEGVRCFKGRHFLGGRFVSKVMEEKHQLKLPAYPGFSQIVELPRVAEEEGSQKL
ncbi:NAD(P)H-hydrate epimerase, partial [Grifola frondosa]